METKIRIESYKLYWHAEQKHGGAAMLLAGPPSKSTAGLRCF
jgi:hypothetical protein